MFWARPRSFTTFKGKFPSPYTQFSVITGQPQLNKKAAEALDFRGPLLK
jgi:hypothetical protein